MIKCLCYNFQDEETPASLYKVAALLLQHSLIDLETLYPHVSVPGEGIPLSCKCARGGNPSIM
jgi:hypothetical protein